MTFVPVRTRRKLIRVAVSAAAAGALVLSVPAPASAFSDPDVSGCLDFNHSRPLFSTKQKVVGTNTCSVGPFGFRVYTSVYTGRLFGTYSETSNCIMVGAHRSAGWEWPKGRSYQIIGC